MDNQTALNTWLRLFGERMGANLALNEEGACAFLCERDIPVVVAASGESFHLYAELVEFSQELMVDTQLLMRAMRLNQFQFMTGGANLVLGGGGQMIALGFSHVIEGVSPEDFCAIMASFLDKCADMQECLLEKEETQTRDVDFYVHSFA